MIFVFRGANSSSLVLKFTMLVMLVGHQLSCHRALLSRTKRSLSMLATSSLRASSNALPGSVWQSSVGQLKGVGVKTAEILQQIDISTIADALFHFPTSVIDRRKRTLLSAAVLGDLITVQLCVGRTTQGSNGRPHSIFCHDSEGTPIEIKYFYASAFTFFVLGEIKRDFVENMEVLVNGKLGVNKMTNGFEIVNPDIVVSAFATKDIIDKKLGVEPIYGLTKGLKNSKMRTIIECSLQHIRDDQNEKVKNKESGEWLSLEQREERDWPSLVEALNIVHNPTCSDDISMTGVARRRLAFDDFVSQFLHQMERQKMQKIGYKARFENSGPTIIDEFGEMQTRSDGFSVIGNREYTDLLISKLPFKLTQCQVQACTEINTDIAGEYKMSRLLQGDVGSGKTVVAILSALTAIEDNRQAAIIAPTTLLANQHYKLAAEYFDLISDSLCLEASGGTTDEIIFNPENVPNPQNIPEIIPKNIPQNIPNPKRRLRVELLTGAVKNKARENLLSDLKNGLIDLLIGTHALLSEPIIDCIPSLGIVVIDEEQRFGVNQRDVIASRTNTLQMTATPIPRSLFVLSENENTISTLIEKPPSRREVQTIILPYSRVDSVIDRISEHILYGTKVFWVSPTLQANVDNPTGCSAMERYNRLSNLFPGKVGLLHGKMTSEEKDTAMAQFAEVGSGLSILVATTVVEVGVDVPESSMCIIDKADVFGLSQLHQIRGRIGRGKKPEKEILDKCFCVLLYEDTIQTDLNTGSSRDKYDEPLPTFRPIPAKLKILTGTDDGFLIAEKDLEMRGPGDFFGSQQTGLRFSGLRAGDFIAHVDLLKDAHSTAAAIYNSTYRCAFHDPRIQNILSLFPPPSSSPTSSPSPPASSSPPSSSTSTSIKKSTSKSVLQKSIEVEPSMKSKLDFTNLEGPESPVIIIFDLETTGLFKSDFITQFAATVIDSSGIGSSSSTTSTSSPNYFNEYVLTKGKKVPWTTTRINGITTEMLEEKGKTFPVVWDLFLKWLQYVSISKINGECRPVVLVGHNLIAFDLPVLDYQIKRYDLNTQGDWMVDANVKGLLDTLHLFRDRDIWTDRKRVLNLPNNEVAFPVKHSLGILHKFVLDRDIENAHNAIYDVFAVRDILESEGLKDIWRMHANRKQTMISASNLNKEAVFN